MSLKLLSVLQPAFVLLAQTPKTKDDPTMKRLSLIPWIFTLALTTTGFAEEFNRTKLPIAQAPFKGKVGLKASESRKDFPAEVSAPHLVR